MFNKLPKSNNYHYAIQNSNIKLNNKNIETFKFKSTTLSYNSILNLLNKISKFKQKNPLNDFGEAPKDDQIDKVKSDLKGKIRDLLNILDSQNATIGNLQDKFSQIDKNIQDAQNNIDKVNKEIEDLEAKVKEEKKELNTEQTKLEKENKELDKEESIEQGLNDQLSAARIQLGGSNKSEQDSNIRLQNIKMQTIPVKNEIKLLENNIDQTDIHIKQLEVEEEEYQKAKAYVNGGHATKMNQLNEDHEKQKQELELIQLKAAQVDKAMTNAIQAQNLSYSKGQVAKEKLGIQSTIYDVKPTKINDNPKENDEMDNNMLLGLVAASGVGVSGIQYTGSYMSAQNEAMKMYPKLLFDSSGNSPLSGSLFQFGGAFSENNNVSPQSDNSGQVDGDGKPRFKKNKSREEKETTNQELKGNNFRKINK